MTQNNIGIYASQISGHLWAPNGAMDALATVTVPSGGVASVTFSGIPAGYKHLQLRGFTQGNRATYPIDGLRMRINGDTGTNYRWHYLQGDGGGVGAGDSGADSSLSIGQPGTNASSGAFSATVLDILDYANTSKNKVTRSLNGLDVNGTVSGYGGVIALVSGLWLNTSAITSLTFYPQLGTQFNQYSSFALYGVK